MMQGHGLIELNWQGNVLYVDAFGPFNEEGVVSCAQKYINEIKNKTCEQFYVIETWDKDSFGSPKVYEVVDKNWASFQAFGCLGIAVVVSDNLQKSLAEKVLPSFPSQAFTTLEQAQSWISSLNAL